MKKLSFSSLPILIRLLVAGLGLYWLYLLVMFTAQVFVFGGYNFFFYFDNLLTVTSLDAVWVWAAFGALPGSIAGTAIAIKKYQLSRRLLFYPSGAALMLLAGMGFINKPAQYAVYEPSVTSSLASASTHRNLYTLTSNVNVRSGPSRGAAKLFVLEKYSQVEVTEAFRGKAGDDVWYKIVHQGREGYISSQFVRYEQAGN
jgi:hypothetical protein